MEDKMLMEGILWDTKVMADLCLHGAIESWTEGVHETFLIGLKEILTMQHEIYLTMQEQGFYEPSCVLQEQLDKIKAKFEPFMEEKGK